MQSDGTQACVRCGLLLTDYRNTVVPDGTPALSGWAEGAAIEVIEGNPRALFMTDDAPDCVTR